MSNKQLMLKHFDKEIVELAEDVFGEDLGRYYVTRAEMAIKTDLDADDWNSYLLTGKYPGEMGEDMRLFERMRRRYEIQLRKKAPKVTEAVQFDILKRKIYDGIRST